ncbi:MAG: hypothetical protein NVSMB32_14300 [Actinomycetota bacterium]
MRTQRFTAVVMAAGMVAVGCSKKATPAAGSSPGAGASSVSSPAAPALCPLTNLPATGGSVPNRPVYAVKMPNDPTARGLQVGPENADIVYEEPVEGGITRWILLFQCQDATRIEPVRSARFVDIDVLAQYGKPIFGHAGGIGPVLDALKHANLTDADYSSSKFTSSYRRDTAHSEPNNLYTSTKDIYGTAGSGAGPAPSPVFSFTANAAVASPPAVSGTSVSGTATAGAVLKVPFSAPPFNVTWTWDAASGTYRRSYDTGKTTTTPANLGTGGQIATKNVVVQLVAVAPGPYVEDATGTHENNVTMVGTGKAIVCRLGACVKGTWSRSGLSSVTKYLDASGAEIGLAPGSTWVELEPNNQVPSTS